PAPPGQDRPVRLPSGAVLPLSLIAALAAAVVAARLLRSRRRRVPTPPGQPVPTDPPLPLVVREILRASRPPTDDTDNPDDGDGNDDGQGPQDPEPGSDPDPVPASERHDPPRQMPAGPSPTPRPADAIPGPAEAGDLDEPLAELLRTGRLDLHGPGAPAAARALLVHVLAAHHSDHTAWPSRLIIPSGLADRLDLPHAVLDVLPQVTITATTQNALDLADREALRRARLAEDTTAASLEELRAGLPDEMIPTVLLVATVASADDGRLGALAHAGARVGLYLLTLDPTGGPAGDGQPAPPWHLTPAQTRDLLRLLADAADQPTPTTDSPPPTETAAPNPMVEALPAPPTGTPPPPDPGPPPVPAEPPADDPPTTSTVDEPAGQPGHLDRPGPRVRLMLFGRPAVHLDGTPLVGGLRTLSLEIAAHLAVHPSGVTGDRLAADLLPDQDPTRARNQAYRAVAALRDTLRTATGDPTLTPILNSKAGYRLNPAVVDVDVWEFDAALHAAGHAPDDPARVLALTRAVALATATPLGDTAYDWSAPIVADLEHRAVDTLADLADLLADDHPDRALAYLEQALALTPTVEDLYRHVMSLHAARGRVDAVRRTYQRLRDALDAHGLDVDPTPETQALLAHLTRTPRPTPAPATTGPRRIVRPAIRHPDRPST
ncbi:hypothetical protein ACG83_40855, partial [Frankia sp. R43]|uniref:bacterial transcriptional activator domain-containing protein n=1 Tax=Frankia sp. R43 TaxID=269536 RepID=UPI0006CA322D